MSTLSRPIHRATTSTSAMNRVDRWTRAGLLDAAPVLGTGLTPQDKATVNADVQVLVVAARPGQANPLPASGARMGFLRSGVLLRQVDLGSHRSAIVYGPGDLIGLDQDSPVGAEVVPVTLSWSVHAPSMIVVLDDAALARIGRYPALLARLLDRAVAQLDQISVETTATTMPRVDDRLLWLLWLFAARFGRMTSDGVLLPLRLTHQRLAEIIGARRPTVSLALQRLVASGAIVQPRKDAWLLTGAAPGSDGDGAAQVPAYVEMARASRQAASSSSPDGRARESLA